MLCVMCVCARGVCVCKRCARDRCGSEDGAESGWREDSGEMPWVMYPVVLSLFVVAMS